jgi:hypothetical protein
MKNNSEKMTSREKHNEYFRKKYETDENFRNYMKAKALKRYKKKEKKENEKKNEMNLEK